MAGSADVIIVGGGIIGLAIAREAARAGLRVILLERGEPGCEASAAAAGIIGAQIEAQAQDPLLTLALASRDLYPEFARRVAGESGLDPRLMDHGTILLARGPGEMAHLEGRFAFQRAAGLPVERLDPEALRRLEPSLGEGIAGGLYLPRDRSVDNVILVRGLLIAAERGGALVRAGTAVTRLLVERGRVTGVEARSGERLAAGAVVIAAGAWAGEIGGDGVPPLPSHPVRGQIAALEAVAPRQIVFSEGCYLVPRRDGRVLVGSTMERVGFDRSVTAEAIAALTAAAAALVPALRGAPVRATWAGLRPACEDGLPAIGPGAAPGLFYACGHLRNGILLAPITARLVTALLRGEPPDPRLAPFSPLRFTPGAPRPRPADR